MQNNPLVNGTQQPLEHREIKRTLWQRWMAWNGSFLVVSLLVHIILIVLAGLLVVQVIQANKEKLRFTAAPPAPASVVHEVKHAKKTASAAPAVTKRITSTAINTSVALPTMDLNTSHNTDIMASVMSGLGGAGLGAGAAGGGIASMPMEGLTAFGFRGGNAKGLVGHFYDLKQTPARKPSDCQSNDKQIALFNEFFHQDRNEGLFDKYYKAHDQLVAPQIFIPMLHSPEGPKSFGVEKEVPGGSHWVVLYKGTVTAPKTARYRFQGYADDVLAVRFNNDNVLAVTTSIDGLKQSFPDLNVEGNERNAPFPGKWFSVDAGKSYPIEVLISEVPGGFSEFMLTIQEEGITYGKQRNNPKYPAYPVFQVIKGVPIPPYAKAKPGQQVGYVPDTDADPVVFPGK